MSQTTNFAIPKPPSTWMELHPGKGSEEMIAEALDNVDTALTSVAATAASGAASAATQDVVTARPTDTSAPIAQKTGTVMLTKSSAGAWTLAAPTATTDDGKVLAIIAASSFAHTVITPAGKLNGGSTTATFAAAGDSIELEAYQGVWYTRNVHGAVIS